MSVTVRHIDPQCKPAQYLTLPQLESIIAPQVIQEVLTECAAWEQREKKLHMQAMIYLIIALALYPHCSTREVYRRLLEGLGEPTFQHEEVPTAGALCQRRQQLAVTPLRSLFARIARPLALPQTRAAFRFGLRVVAVDGTLENLPDTEANRTVFPSHCQEELARSPFPQARCVLLMEGGTHVIFDAEFTAVQQGELGSVLTLLERSLTCCCCAMPGSAMVRCSWQPAAKAPMCWDASIAAVGPSPGYACTMAATWSRSIAMAAIRRVSR
jgi:Insertion element 4 transposase N-terminal